MTEKISIIVPVYNAEQYLVRCLDSILSQSFENFELILIDDGSLDHSGDICDNYAEKESRIKVIHQQNAGVSVARNTALDIMTGQYVVFCDSDDYWEQDWLKALYAAINDSQYDMVSADYKIVDDRNNIFKKKENKEGLYQFQKEIQLVDYIISDILSGHSGWEIWTRIFKAAIIRQNHIRFCESCHNFAEDMGFVLEYLMYCTSVKHIKKDGYCYVKRESSMMQCSVNEIKFDSLNEVSLQVGKRYSDRKALRRQFPIIHFMIMYDQYTKVLDPVEYDLLENELKKIRNIYWYNKQTAQLWKYYFSLRSYFGKENAERMILFSRFCSKRNRKLYSIQTAVYYKFFWKRCI